MQQIDLPSSILPTLMHLAVLLCFFCCLYQLNYQALMYRLFLLSCSSGSLCFLLLIDSPSLILIIFQGLLHLDHELAELELEFEIEFEFEMDLDWLAHYLLYYL